MTAVNFCYWLQGFFEIREAAGDPSGVVNSKQVEIIKRHLSLVFVHDIDPKAGPPEHQKKLNDIHSPLTVTSGGVTVGKDVVVRC